MIRKFLKDVRGSYTIATVIVMVPILGGLALAVDFSEMNRQRQATVQALEAAGLATAWRFDEGATDDQLKAYAKEFFEANLGPVDPADTKLNVTLPSSTTGGGTLKLQADLVYDPYFYPAFAAMLNGGSDPGSTQINFKALAEIRLKNTLEVALVLDNSGSMDIVGTGSGEKRLALLKAAAKELVSTIAKQAYQIKQVSKPVQFALVPFSASVNVGPENSGESWMDTLGISPVHHENFDWTTLSADISPTQYAEWSGGAWYKRGVGWGLSENQALTRFSLYKDITTVTARERVRKFVCKEWRANGTCKNGETKDVWEDTAWGPFADWQGCVEARPAPYNYSDTPASMAIPATLFVPMFGPDEPGERWDLPSGYESPRAYNSWWNDDDSSTTHKQRQSNMRKYLEVRPFTAPAVAEGKGPNLSCTTNPITPLQDVTVLAGKTVINDAIDGMEANGATNVPEGMAWGWRAVSGGAPFTEGRGDHEKGNNKVVIVLTDGENTYYTPGSLSASDPAGNKSTYSAFGYTAVNYPGADTTRLFMDTTDTDKFTFSNANYTLALNEQFDMLCDNVKSAGVMVMTVALDLDATKEAQKKQIEALTACASESRTRKGEKLFWNAKGGDLAETFRKIADELSNLRIVG